MEIAPDALKFSYPEVLVGLDAMRALLANNLAGDRSRSIADLVRRFTAAQWDYDSVIRFKQVGMDAADLNALFVDVQGRWKVGPESERHKWSNEPSGSYRVGGAELLLGTAFRHMVILGAPGQGKSTLLQYVCQVYRATLLDKQGYLGAVPEELRQGDRRLALRADLRDFGRWLDGRDPFAEEVDGTPIRRPKGSESTLESFLAHLMHVQSGGRALDVETVHEIFDRYPVLLALDGLDEVADERLRERVVQQLSSGLARLDQGMSKPLAVITSRPSFSSLAEPPARQFDYFELVPLTERLRTQYVRKWSKLQNLTTKDARDLARIFKARSADAHVRDLVENPMQLTILLYLMHRRGESVPAHRTNLYRDYMSLFLDREVAKSPQLSPYSDLLEEVTRFLGWTLQAAAEADADNGRVSLGSLKRKIRHYLADQDKPTDLVDELFTAVTQRVWAITSRVQNNFEFDVQPVREFFAAEHLALTAPPSRREGSADKFDRIAELVVRPYWLNTARFMAGSFTDGELGTLVETLDSLQETEPTRMWTRRATRLLLNDGTFDARPKSTKTVTRNIHDLFGQRLLLHDIQAGESPPLDPVRGGAELAKMLREQLMNDPLHRLAGERARLLALHDAPELLAQWWHRHFPHRSAQSEIRAWLLVGIPLQAAAGLAPAEIDQLGQSHPDAPALLLAGGGCPTAGSVLERATLDAVLGGECSELGAGRPSYPADLLRALLPSRFLRKAKNEGAPDLALFGLSPPAARLTAPEPALSRLRKRAELLRILAAANESRGQRGTTSVWGNVAREVARQFGPCWLASEIAIIGASSFWYRTGGDVTPGATAFGPAADFGTMILEVRTNRHDRAWWRQEASRTTSDLEVATWSLALASCADLPTLVDALDLLAGGLEAMAETPRRVLMRAAARLGIYGVARSVNTRIVGQAANSSIWNALLLAPFVPPAERRSLLMYLPPEMSIQMATHDTYGWPVVWAACQGLNGSRLSILEAARWDLDHAPMTRSSLAEDIARRVLTEPENYPWPVVVAGDMKLEHARRTQHLREVAEEQIWFDVDN